MRYGKRAIAVVVEEEKMHSSAYEHGRLFFDLYWRPEFAEVIELGSQNVNGSLRDHSPPGARYVGMDMAPGNGVDLIVTPGTPFPIADETVDVAVTSSAFEHDVCFWETFLDLMRVLKPGGLLYVNAPSNYAFHRYPVDCWRFYPDAGYALTVWASRRGVAVDLLESFVAKPHGGIWADYVAVFRKGSDVPFERKGRIADFTTAINIFDIANENPMQLEAETAETWEMMETIKVQAELAQTLASLEQANAQIAEMRTQIAALGGQVTSGS
jgi:SAM-dependent methyltransferase